MRESKNEYIDNKLWNGYDYDNQAWVQYGRYLRCGHPDNMDCQCYGKLHAGEKTTV